ncbi:isoprenoid biosynthesis glyoxalase ElbB [Anaplasma capra]|uniref:isoprenoid biosynthesis glyoxalase ElbB n=1 Tax=Anaplasma capra TaxID=1562740 RepID=UPI0021D5CD3A|nr:isoprenoid biosynthesis glyoxalase ElbB [Anaplasma capra]MCU7611179.1 isoprenoid biosynthesis glyoxalase ElbB [Anaplasma capra]MCU7612317.1 isoprenoid biosynthesis glyoxalase ElbB [Anaplasma capra]
MNCMVLLSGCGHMDGSEIRESVLVLLELDRLNVKFLCCAPNSPQQDVVNHISKSQVGSETRNILEESARIARGDVIDIREVQTSEFDMLVIPGGFGVAKNFSNLVSQNGPVEVLGGVKSLIQGFYLAKKAIGAVCIAPAIVASALSELVRVQVTLGDDTDGIISRCGGEHVACPTDDYVTDEKNRIFSCSAYMRDDRLYKVHIGIQKMVEGMTKLVRESRS